MWQVVALEILRINAALVHENNDLHLTVGIAVVNSDEG